MLSTGTTVTKNFAKVHKSAKGDEMVEVIVEPSAIPVDGSFAGAVTDLNVVIHDNPLLTKTNPHPGDPLPESCNALAKWRRS